jgi:carboxyl-terminal processing protease
MPEFSKTRYLTGVIFLIILSFVGGIFLGIKERTEIEKIVGISSKETPSEITDVDFSPFWKAWNTINEKYPGASKISNQDRLYGAISGLMSSLNDPYSVFFPPEEAKSFEDQIAGNFSGVGMEVGLKDDILTVIAPLKDTPAYRAGIKSGDKILKINDVLTSDITVDKAIKLIRGEKGTEVTLTILHVGEQKSEEIKIVRDTINIPTLETEKRADGIFVIRLFTFSANSANLFRDALKEFAYANTDKLLLDLRGNPGGYLDSAVYISSWFLPEGKIIVTEDYGGGQAPEIFRSRGFSMIRNKNENPLGDNLKFVILIDSGSASASEIVSGAIQDHKRALLVGDQSYGKGSVQEVIDMTKDTIMKITIAKWLTPNGNTIAEKGLTPDYLVKYVKNTKDIKKDNQLDKAVDLLNNWPGIK